MFPFANLVRAPTRACTCVCVCVWVSSASESSFGRGYSMKRLYHLCQEAFQRVIMQILYFLIPNNFSMEEEHCTVYDIYCHEHY